jgi:hypothetical protein
MSDLGYIALLFWVGVIVYQGVSIFRYLNKPLAD